MAASGKTTLLKWLHQNYPEANFLNDSEEIIEFVQQDTEENYHIKPTDNTFLLTDSAAVHHSVERLIEKAAGSEKTNIIELSRGLDQEGIVDFSYEYLFSQLPDEVRKNSLFVYVYSPFAARKQRNSGRPKLNGEKPDAFTSFHCPDEAMERFFQEDDFFEALKNNTVDSLVLSNIYSLEEFYSKIEKAFGN